jgi:hypothetical protein
MGDLWLRVTAVEPLDDDLIEAGAFDADKPLRDQRQRPERVRMTVPVGPGERAEAEAFLAKFRSLESVREGRRRCSIVAEVAS